MIYRKKIRGSVFVTRRFIFLPRLIHSLSTHEEEVWAYCQFIWSVVDAEFTSEKHKYPYNALTMEEAACSAHLRNYGR